MYLRKQQLVHSHGRCAQALLSGFGAPFGKVETFLSPKRIAVILPAVYIPLRKTFTLAEVEQAQLP